MLTNKGKYGLKAMVHLASLEPGTTTMGAEIAMAENIPKKFLDAILLDLRNAGIVRTKKGPGGDYSLARTPKASVISSKHLTARWRQSQAPARAPMCHVRTASISMPAKCGS